MTIKKIASWTVLSLVLLTALTAQASDGEVGGVFGLSPVTEDAALAMWVPLETDESIIGVMWYNNDGSKVFPEVLAVAGNPAHPSVLLDAVTVGEDVSGATLEWSEYTFSQAIASAMPGLYLIFRLPQGGEFTGEGQGAGIGYRLGDGQIRSWISAGDDEWDPLSPAYQMAVAPIMNSDKSGDVLVLGAGGNESRESEGATVPSIPEAASLKVGPNPFNPQTEIRLGLPEAAFAKLTIYDVRGRQVRRLLSEPLAAGVHSVRWNGRDGAGRAQASGVYLALFETGSIRLTKRLTLVQ